MLVKLFLKIWPALIPITLYIFWVFVIERFLIQKILKKNSVIEGEKVVGERSTEVKLTRIFSLQNQCFLLILYLTLVLGILTLIALAL